MIDNFEPPKDLQDLWIGKNAGKENIDMMVEQVLEQDRRYRKASRREDIVSIVIAAVFLPLLMFLAADARAPILRVGYGMMAIGSAVTIVALWLYHNWVRQAPSTSSTSRTHLEQSVEYLDRQAKLYRTSVLWCGAPVFIGGFLIGLAAAHANVWLGAVMCGGSVLAWIGTWHRNGVRKVREIEQRKARVQQVLQDLM